MRLGLIIVLLCRALSLFAAERTPHWRSFQVGEAPVDSVTLSPLRVDRGEKLHERVVARHSNGTAVTILDGYSTRDVRLPEGVGFRVFESRSGQLWATHPDGLWLLQRGQWNRFYIPEIRAEPQRVVRPLSVVPAEINRAFFLASGRLMEFDATLNRASVIKAASETRLGVFYEMVETSDGGLLLSGLNGVARVSGPLRGLNASSKWMEFPLPPNIAIESLQRPIEGRDGSILVVGFDRETSSKRHLLTVRTNGATMEEVVQERLRFTWNGWDNSRWAMSFNGLFRYAEGQRGWVREGGSDTYYDVATETNGVFWLATSGGLVRYAPQLWRAPTELASQGFADAPCSAIAQGESAMWFATAEGLIRVDDERAARFAWPEDFEASLSVVQSLHELRGGNVMIGTARDPLVFDAARRTFSRLPGGDLRVLGVLRDGSACVRVSTNGVERLDRYEGGQFKTLIASLADIGAPADPAFAVETRSGDLWLGGNFGLARYRFGEAKAEVFSAAQGLAGERVQCVSEIAEEKIWAGAGDSIFELRGNRWEKIWTGQGRVRSIFRGRDGAVWVTAGDGVHQYYLNNAWLTHGEDEGLPSLLAPGVAEDRHGRIWAATSRGVAVFNRDSDTDEPRTLAPSVEENEGEEGRVVTVRFSGVDKWNYTLPARLLYSYRMDEGAWSTFTNTSSITFSNLSAGPHYIQTRAMDRAGNQDASVAALEFAVTLPWRRDPRLLAVLALGLAAVIFFAGLAVNRHLQLKRSYAEVELKIAERTAQLERANQELLHSQKMRALGTLAAGIAHDFNNILSIIKGSAQIIQNNPDDRDKVLTRVNRIQTVVDQGAGIVRSMLGLGKTGDQVECNAGELVEETIRLIGDRFPSEVQIRYQKIDAPSLVCSKSVIHQILVNLILNAVDASGGAGTVTMRTRVANAPGAGLPLMPSAAPAYLAIDVMDQGGGIAAEVMPRIFEPFYTTKSFSSRRGTGLGLSMVYELAKGLGYGLAVESKPGAGSTFTVLIPLTEQKASGAV